MQCGVWVWRREGGGRGLGCGFMCFALVVNECLVYENVCVCVCVCVCVSVEECGNEEKGTRATLLTMIHFRS